ncbi:prolyl oligopeptidase family serine peptidase, partial [Streptomyces sp. NPDC004126]|uniref:prolyl oligopeptidase family serine peptidase n=1 Tax=Streptomyces sp. NPDC004126 TaxID=3390695 RepID=UPI003CFD19F1
PPETTRHTRHEPDAAGASGPRPLTAPPEAGAKAHYVDPVVVERAAEVWCVRERWSAGADPEAVRDLVAVPLDGRAAADADAVRVLAAGRDFFTGPRLSPDGRRVAWIAWDHPRMPWDGSEACVADVLEDGATLTLGVPRVVAGGPEEAVAQVEWAGPDSLYAVTDRSGWWNLYRVAAGTGGAADTNTGAAVALCPRAEEFAGPLTKIGFSWCAPLDGSRVAVLHHGPDGSGLSVLDTGSGELKPLAPEFTEWAALLCADGDRILAVGAGPARDFAALLVDARTGRAETLSVHRSDIDEAYLPVPSQRTFTDVRGQDVHAVLFPPRNPRFAGPAGELPPYVVFAHSGPTDRFPAAFSLEVAYFTSRGIGVAAVDYAGSAGYGRAYRDRLRHAWGLQDADDCATVAAGLVAEGLADGGRLGIRGRSAGGWTAAVSLTRSDLYRCGALYYPILDMAVWRAGQRHGEFEAYCCDTLVGPWPAERARYEERSPASNTAGLTAPFLLLQGTDDPICPPGQAAGFLDGARRRGIPYRHLLFDGERHGFKRGAHVVAALEAELELYRQTFGSRP